MQVPTPWDDDHCLALATMLNRCGFTSLIEVSFQQLMIMIAGSVVVVQ